MYFQETWKFLPVYEIFDCQIDQGTYSNGKADAVIVSLPTFY